MENSDRRKIGKDGFPKIKPPSLSDRLAGGVQSAVDMPGVKDLIRKGYGIMIDTGSGRATVIKRPGRRKSNGGV